MKAADGFEPDAVIGPLIDMKAVDKVEAHIADIEYSPLVRCPLIKRTERRGRD
jgi:hypothetical protein